MDRTEPALSPRRLAGGDLPFLLVALLAATALLQQVLVPELAPWISDQGRDSLWAERIAAGAERPANGPAAAGELFLSTFYFYWLALLRWLGVEGWRIGSVLGAAAVAAAALLLLTHRRHAAARGAVLAIGLWQAHAAFGPLQRMASNPAWIMLPAAVVLALVAGFPRAATARAAMLRAALAAVIWMAAVQLHLTALFWGPALLVSVWLLPARLRIRAAAAAAVAAAVALILLMGGWSEALDFVSALLAPHPAPGAAGWGQRLAHWVSLPVAMARWWWHAGTLSVAGFAGAVAHWLLVLAGLALAAVALARARGSERTYLAVLVAWAAGGLLMPLALEMLAFYYLVGALPVLYLAAGAGLAAQRGTAWLSVAVLLLANVTVAELNGGLRRSGEFVAPPGSLWWTRDPTVFPTLAASRAVVGALREAGVSYPCAIAGARGRAWVGAMLDGGYLASRTLAAGQTGACRPLRVWLDAGDGRARVAEVAASEPAGWPPVAAAPTTTAPFTPVATPFSGEIQIPADGRARSLSVYAEVPPELDCSGLSFKPLGFHRWLATTGGHAPCRISGRGEPAWIDIELLPDANAPLP